VSSRQQAAQQCLCAWQYTCPQKLRALLNLAAMASFYSEDPGTQLDLLPPAT
jgi:hypothetical protein